jgi:hypothetical protein
MKDTLSLCCMHLLLKLASVALNIIINDKEQYSNDI